MRYNGAASDSANRPAGADANPPGARNCAQMEETANQPLYWAKDRVPFNLTLILALGIAAWGVAGELSILPPPGNPIMIIILGVGVAIYTWLFTPRQYMVYQDALCIAYGQPRVKVMHFSNIAVVELGSSYSIDQLRVRPVKGRRQAIRVRDPETFCQELEAALSAFRAAHPELDVSVETPERPPAQVVDAESTDVVDAGGATDAPEAPELSSNPEAGSDAPQPPAETPGEEEPPPQEHRPLY